MRRLLFPLQDLEIELLNLGLPVLAGPPPIGVLARTAAQTKAPPPALKCQFLDLGLTSQSLPMTARFPAFSPFYSFFLQA